MQHSDAHNSNWNKEKGKKKEKIDHIITCATLRNVLKNYEA